MGQQTEWVAVDWGTSNLRAWGVDASGATTFSHASDQGMGKLTRDLYPDVLTSLLGGEFPDGGPAVDVLVCGMAGARQGWLEAPYVEAPADLGHLLGRAVAPEVPQSPFTVRILPGVCQRQAGREDVMRGEETQLLGLSALFPDFSGVVVMPGTHSKWVELDGRSISRFQTAMTGELFELLSSHSVLRHSLAGLPDEAERDAGFDAGVTAGLSHPEKLTGTLFKVRAASLLSGRSASWCGGLLSGLLIGTEIGGQHDWPTEREIPLVGGVALCSLYARAFALRGARTRIVDATDATLAGLKLARSAA